MSRLLNCPEEILLKIACEVMEISEQYGEDSRWDPDAEQVIAEYTPPEQPILKLRSVSRDFRRITTPIIAKAWFSERRVMLSQNSLQALVDISHHPVFGPAVRTVTVAIDHLRDLDFDFDGNSYHDSLETTFEQQKFLMSSGLGMAYIAEALAGLPNLKEVTIARVATEVRAWGSKTLETMGELWFYTYHELDSRESVNFIAEAVNTVTLAIARSGIFLTCFKIDLWPEDTPCLPGGRYGAAAQASSLRPDELVKNYIRTRPLRSEAVALNLSIGKATEHPVAWAENIQAFIDLFPDMRTLKLMLDDFNRYDHAAHIEELSQKLRVPGLQSLHIGGFECDSATLNRLLCAHEQTLRQVEFSGITMISKTEEPGVDDWQNILCGLRKHLIVTTVVMQGCFQERPRQELFCICDQPPYDGRIEWNFGSGLGHSNGEIARVLQNLERLAK
jgi:hypothetical protein